MDGSAQTAVQIVSTTVSGITQSVGMALRIGELSGRVLLKALALMAHTAANLHQHITTTGDQSLKSLNQYAAKTNTTLEEIKITDTDCKAVRKRLRKLGADFSVYKDQTGQHHIFVKAANAVALQMALEGVVAASVQQEQSKPVQEAPTKQNVSPVQAAAQAPVPPSPEPAEPPQAPEPSAAPPAQQPEVPAQAPKTPEPEAPHPAPPAAPPKNATLDDAIDAVVEAGTASNALVQRELHVSYTRAATFIDQMEEMGIVGPFAGNKPRKVLITKEQWAERKAAATHVDKTHDPARYDPEIPQPQKLRRFDDLMAEATEKARVANAERVLDHEKAVAKHIGKQRRAAPTR